jgi:hypothetical protein
MQSYWLHRCFIVRYWEWLWDEEERIINQAVWEQELLAVQNLQHG